MSEVISVSFVGLSIIFNYHNMIRKDLRRALWPTTRSKTRSTAKRPAVFADDPSRGPTLHLPPEEIEQLNGENFLSTRLVDYIIQCGMPHTLQENVLIGSSNSLTWFQVSTNAQSHCCKGLRYENPPLIIILSE
jgi:hypothetical protein